MTITLQAYHGTCANITQFNHDFNGTNTCNNVGGFFFSSDYYAACDYSMESYKRMHEYDEIYKDNETLLNDHATEQMHVYKCNVTFNNPLILDIEQIRSKNIYNFDYAIDILKMNSLIYMMNDCNMYCSDSCFSVDELQNASMDFLDLFETYNEDTDEYEPLEPYDGLIIKNACDGIGEYSNYTQADVIIALNPYQIQITDCIYDMKEVA